MKKMMKKVVVPAFLAATMTLSGCFGSKKKNPGSSEKETYTFSNYDATYYVGESFNIVGTKLTISDVYGNTTTITVTEDMIVSMPDMSVEGEKVVVIKYNDKEYKFTINVLALTEEYLFVKKLQELKNNYKNYSSTITFDSTSDISFGYLGNNASYEDLKTSGLLNTLLGEGELSSEVYDALLSALVEGSLNLKETDVLDVEALKAKFNVNGALSNLLSELTSINYISHILNANISEEEDQRNIAYITSMICYAMSIDSEEGYTALETIIKSNYNTLKGGRIINPVDLVKDIVNVVKVHTNNPSIKTTISTIKNFDINNVRHLISDIASEYYNEATSVMTADSFVEQYWYDGEPVFVTSNIANLTKNEYITVTVNRIKGYEDLIFGLLDIRSIDDAKALLSNCVEANVNYAASMKDVYTILKAQNWVIATNQGDGFYTTDVYIDYYTEEPIYDDDIETFATYEQNWTELYEAIVESGLSGFAKESGLLEELFGADSEIAFTILNGLESDPANFDRFLVDTFLVEEDSYYVDNISEFLINYGCVSGAVGQKAVKDKVTLHFTAVKENDVKDAKEVWVDILSTINKYTTDDMVRSATESLESLELDKIVHIMSDLMYINALNEIKIISNQELENWWSSYDGYDFAFETGTAASSLIERWAKNEQDKVRLFEDVILTVLGVRSFGDVEDGILNTLDNYISVIEEYVSIVEELKDNSWVIGSIDDEGDFSNELSWDCYNDSCMIDYDWDIESSLSVSANVQSIRNSVEFGFNFLRNPVITSRSFVEEYKDTIMQFVRDYVDYDLRFNGDAVEGICSVVDASLDRYVEGTLSFDGLLDDISAAVEEYANEEAKTTLNAIYTLITALNYDPNIDYNEVFAFIPLPEGIQSIDYNVLMAKLYDKSTYDMLNIDNAEVTYITDMGGNVTGAVITFDLVVDFDAVIAYIDGTLNGRIIVDFK